MSATQVRVEIPYELYRTLNTDQEKRRIKTGKKPSLSSIVLEYCNKWVKVKDNAPLVQSKPQPTQTIPVPDEPLNGLCL